MNGDGLCVVLKFRIKSRGPAGDDILSRVGVHIIISMHAGERETGERYKRRNADTTDIILLLSVARVRHKLNSTRPNRSINIRK